MPKQSNAHNKRKYQQSDKITMLNSSSKKIKSSSVAAVVVVQQKAVPAQLTPFMRSVYVYTKLIPAGCVSTYKGIATAINHPTASRAVGTALRRNPFAPIVPCHRVISSDLTLGGFMGSKPHSADCNIDKKISMLRSEGVKFDSANKISEKSVMIPKLPNGQLLTDHLMANQSLLNQ
jgi:methylated-DNA-[protein]-cysteine S-methyltransferase